jgi:hypothetical protein
MRSLCKDFLETLSTERSVVQLIEELTSQRELWIESLKKSSLDRGYNEIVIEKALGEITISKKQPLVVGRPEISQQSISTHGKKKSYNRKNTSILTGGTRLNLMRDTPTKDLYGTKPVSIVIGNEMSEVKSWKDVLVFTFGYIAKYYPQKLEDLVDHPEIVATEQPTVGKSPAPPMRKAFQIPNSIYYVETNIESPKTYSRAQNALKYLNENLLAIVTLR